MILISIILLIAVILIVLLFTVALKIKIVFETHKSDLYMTLLWLHSLLKALVTVEDNQPMLSFYLLNKRLFKKTLKRGKNKVNGSEFPELNDFKDICVNVRYSFSDPYKTGITCGALNAASQLFNIASINHVPDFTAGNDYIYLNATAKLNLGSTLIKLFKHK